MSEAQATSGGAASYNSKSAVAALSALLTLFLLPVQIDAIGYNYSMLLLPLAAVLATGKIVRPPSQFVVIMALYAVIFVAACAYQYQYLAQLDRRIISFVLFMAMFSYTFMRVSAELVAAFKAALVAISVLLSAYSMYVFFSSGGSAALGFEAKDLVGSQRVGFVYLLAFWLVFLQRGSGRVFALYRYGTLTVLLSGLFLTFSRASIVGLLVSLGAFGLSKVMAWCKRPNFRAFVKGVATVILVAMMAMLLYALVPLAFAFFRERLFVFLGNSDAVREDLADMYSTGGTRVYLLHQIFKFVLENPLTGSGYLGVWILPGLGGDFVASAHNQYGDVLFRTGFIGALAYGYVLILTLKFLYASHRSLFWGFLSVLAYGMFHETFKESQGGFVLAFLVGMVSQSMPDWRLNFTSGGASTKQRAVLHGT